MHTMFCMSPLFLTGFITRNSKQKTENSQCVTCDRISPTTPTPSDRCAYFSTRTLFESALADCWLRPASARRREDRRRKIRAPVALFLSPLYPHVLHKQVRGRGSFPNQTMR